MLKCPSCGAANDEDVDTCFTCGRRLSAVLTRGSVVASRYEMLETLGRGGMGMVYKAHDRVLEEDIAIKVLRADVARSPETGRRFRSEIRLARRVTHRNVCRIHEYGEDQGLRYISMELIEGVDLRRILRERGGGLPTAEAFHAAIQVARGLQAIHEVGIVHRDLKTSNIMQDTRGTAKLMDFGIAKQEGSGSATATGDIVGTPEYMSPEQARGAHVDARSDVYSLAVVVYEIFSGDVPFRGDTPIVTIFRHVQEPPLLEGPGAPAFPAPLVPVLRRGLAKSPSDRYPSAEMMARALEQAQAVCVPLPEEPASAGPTVPMSVPADFTPAPRSYTPLPGPVRSPPPPEAASFTPPPGPPPVGAPPAEPKGQEAPAAAEAGRPSPPVRLPLAPEPPPSGERPAAVRPGAPGPRGAKPLGEVAGPGAASSIEAGKPSPPERLPSAPEPPPSDEWPAAVRPGAPGPPASEPSSPAEAPTPRASPQPAPPPIVRAARPQARRLPPPSAPRARPAAVSTARFFPPRRAMAWLLVLPLLAAGLGVVLLGRFLKARQEAAKAPAVVAEATARPEAMPGPPIEDVIILPAKPTPSGSPDTAASRAAVTPPPAAARPARALATPAPRAAAPATPAPPTPAPRAEELALAGPTAPAAASTPTTLPALALGTLPAQEGPPPVPRATTPAPAPSPTTPELLPSVQASLAVSRADAAFAARKFEEAARRYEEALSLEPANATAAAGAARARWAAAASRKTFGAGRTVNSPARSGKGPAGFETQDVQVKSQDFVCAIEVEMKPPSVRPGGDLAYTASVSLANFGKKPIKIKSVEAVTRLGGERTSDSLALLSDEVPAKDRLLVAEAGGRWQEGMASWSLEILVTGEKGDVCRSTVSWR